VKPYLAIVEPPSSGAGGLEFDLPGDWEISEGQLVKLGDQDALVKNVVPNPSESLYRATLVCEFTVERLR
jgi:hypothetical protein